MAEIEGVKIRYFRRLNPGDGLGYSFHLKDLKRGDYFRAQDESPFVIWEAASDPYLNADDIWTIDAECVAG